MKNPLAFRQGRTSNLWKIIKELAKYVDDIFQVQRRGQLQNDYGHDYDDDVSQNDGDDDRGYDREKFPH